MCGWSYSSHLAHSFSVSHFLQSLVAASVLSHEPLSHFDSLHFLSLSHEPLSHVDFSHSAVRALNSTSVSLPSLSASCLLNASSSLAVHFSADLWHFSLAHFFSGVASVVASALAVNDRDSEAAASSSNFFMISYLCLRGRLWLDWKKSSKI